jgi:hypothetical protein
VVSIVRAGEARGRVTVHPCSVCVATVRAPASLGFISTTHMRTRNVAHTGDSLLDAVRRAVPGVPVGKILIQRDEAHPLKLPQVVYPRRMQALALRCCSCGSHCNGHHAHTCTHSWRAYLPLRRGPGTMLGLVCFVVCMCSCTTSSFPRTSPASKLFLWTQCLAPLAHQPAPSR